MRRRVVPGIFALAVLLAAPGAQAQQLSEEGDLAFWCHAALDMALERGGFGDAATDGRARNALPALAQRVDAEAGRLGMSAAAKAETMLSFEDELAYQLNDYLQTKNPAALRLDIEDCFAAGAAQVGVRAPQQAVDHYAWCQAALTNQGMRHGQSEDYHRRMAAYALAEANVRLRALATEAAIPAATIGELHQRYLASTEADVAALAAGSAPADFVDRFDRCRAMGLQGTHLEARYADFVAEYDERAWCQAILTQFMQRQMIGGGPERVERGARAQQALTAIVERALTDTTMPSEDVSRYLAALMFRAHAQIGGYVLTGDKGRFERDYEPCFAMADLPLPLPSFVSPPVNEARPMRTAAAWDYPLGFDARFHLWCRAAIRLIKSDPGIASHFFLNEEGRQELLDFANRKLGEEAARLAITAGDRATIEREIAAEVAYEFARYDASGRDAELAYDHGQCAFMDASEKLEEMFAAEDALLGVSPD